MKLKRIGVLTSGGDSPGMNAAIRAAVRVGIHYNATVLGIRDGYEGLVKGNADGERRIFELKSRHVSGILHKGGTFLGTARSEEFKTVEGQKKALENIAKEQIEGLVVIGGDGSLRGARDLQRLGVSVVGLPGSIDNDMPGTDMGIGTDTALNTDIRDIDILSDTASSHHRTFVVEVMGRNCGYLAVMSGLASGASWTLIPEEPINISKLQEMLDLLMIGYKTGKKHGIVVIGEGCNHNANFIKEFIEGESNPKLEVRITIPGHVQRGGSPTPFDRILATRLGAAAAEMLINGESGLMVGLVGNEIKTITFDEIANKSGDSFKILHDKVLNSLKLQRQLSVPSKIQSGGRKIGILTGEADSPGMNAAIRAIVRIAIDEDATPIGIRYGYGGLSNGQDHIFQMDWMSVNGIISWGGTILGTSRHTSFSKSELDQIQNNLKAHDIGGLIAIGGLETLYRLKELSESVNLSIPVCLVPATINNDVPAADFTIGADTVLNTIVEAVDKIKSTAASSRQIFIVEVMGDNCGYLALMSSLASGSEACFIPEEGIKLDEIRELAKRLKAELASGRSHAVILVSERASNMYNADFIRRVMSEEVGLETRITVLGHVQRGGVPSAFDRILASRLGEVAVNQALSGKGVKIAALRGRKIELVDLVEALNQPHEKKFLQLRQLEKILSKPREEF